MASMRPQIAIAVLIPTVYIIWGYLTYWAPRLHFLPYAFIAGVLSATLAIIAVLVLSAQRPDDRRYSATAPQTPAFLAPGAWKEEAAWLSTRGEYNRKPLFPSSFVLSESVDELLRWMLRDFVGSWYRNISSRPDFTNEIDRAVRGALANVKERIESQDVIEVAVSRFVPLLTSHLRLFYDAEQTVRGKKLNRTVTESEELDLAIAAKYRDGKLHPAASLSFSDTTLVQQEYLRKLVTKLLPELLPEHMVESRAVSILIREIVACAVLSPVMQMLADPDTWNQIMEAYGRTMLQDRKTVQKLRAALDEHASPTPKAAKVRAFPKLSPHDDERRFERFIRAIRQCNDLSEVRRFRSEVASQLKRESVLEGQDRVYLRRLETGKRMLDQRVGMLSAVGSSSTPSSSLTDSNESTRSRLANASIQEVLYDASGLSYFMEYMDRQKLMTLVQFYIVVDGFRNPLEDDVLEEHVHAESSRPWTASDRQDIAQIAEAYLSKPELKIPPSCREGVRQFLRAGKSATSIQYGRARSAILRAQSVVLEDMRENHFANFRKSDLWYKFLASEKGAAKSFVKASRAKAPTIVPIAEVINQPVIPARALTRAGSPHAKRQASALRRNATSSSDLRSPANAVQEEPHSRRSLDFNPSRPLFDDDVEPETITQSISSLDDEDFSADRMAGDQAQIVQAMEVALNTIMTDAPQDDEDRKDAVENPDPNGLFGRDIDLARNSGESRTSETNGILGRDEDSVFDSGAIRRSETNTSIDKARGRPNLASLGLVNTSSRIGVFRDNDLFGDEEKFLEDEHEEAEEFTDEKVPEDEIHEAAPGDLGLAEAISALTADIERLVAQESVVDTLNRKAELTNNVAELRILSKSKASLQREIHRKELQRQQYIVQESDNSLYGRADVEIKSVVVGKGADGQEFALYVIEVRRQAGEHMPAASWAVARRYSEFHDLHSRLRNRYPTVRSLEFPRRRLVMKLQRDFLHRRRVSLQIYLRELLRLPDVCRSRDLRAFLSQQAIVPANPSADPSDARADIVTRIYNSVTDGMDEFLGNIPVLDQLTIAGQNLISAATSQYYATTLPSAAGDPSRGGANAAVAGAKEAQAELDAFENQALEPFVKPICDLFLEVFELNRSQNWLRGRAVVVVLHQLLGGTVERKVREMARALFSDPSLLRYLDLARETLWPAGSPRSEPPPARTPPMKKASRREASLVLAALVPELAGSVVGRANAQAAGRRLLAAANNGRLNAHLAFRLLDEVVAVLFPELERGRGRL